MSHGDASWRSNLVSSRTYHTLATLTEKLPVSAIHGDAATAITGITCSTELGDVQAGSLFAPLDLSSPRTAALAAKAASRGAAALLLEQALDIPVPQLIVPDARSALAVVAATFYSHPANEITCIGITGTAGKTTTTLLTYEILRASGLRPGLIGTLDWRIGDFSNRHRTGRTTPEAPDVQRMLRDMVDVGDQTAILEASSQGLEQHRLDTVPFSIGAMTHVTRDHLDFHGSLGAYRRAKARLFERLDGVSGTAVLNADDPASRRMAEYSTAARILTYSAAGQGADVRATDIRPENEHTRFRLSLAGSSTTIQLPLPGAFNVANALCAAAIAHAAEVPLANIAAGLTQSAPIPGLLTTVGAGQPFLVIIDEAKSAMALVHALEVARQRTQQGRIIAVVSASELVRPDLLRQRGEVAELAADYAVFTTARARLVDPASIVGHLADGARAAGGIDGVTYACEPDRRSAMLHALALARPGDCVLITGKGIESTLEVGSLVIPWDDVAIARQILAQMGYPLEPAWGEHLG